MFQLHDCVWEITLACCFSCKYCGSNGGTARENELTTAECLHIADQLANLGCRRVSLIGGEVFMRKDWDIIVERLISHGLRVAIITNGFLFTESILKRLKALAIESIAISLDAPKEIHDRYRQPGSYARAIGAIETLTKNDFAVSVISTLNAENVQYLEEFYSIIYQYPIRAWQLQACSPMGNAANLGIDYHFNPWDVISFVEKHYERSPFPMGIADNIGYCTKKDGHLRGNRLDLSYFSGCRAGLSAIGIDSIGNVRGCESMYDDCFIEGNLRNETLREIWENPNNFSYNRHFTKDHLTGACSACEMGPYCAGGCRSYNHFVHNKLYEAPFCARNIAPFTDI